MGTSGVPWDVSKQEIIAHLKKAKGRITHARKTLNCAHDTLRKRINEDPDLQKILYDLRQEFEEDMLDSAENCLLFALSKQDTDLANSLKSSFFILNNKGKERGYSKSNNPNNQEASTDDIASFIRQTIANSEEISRIEDAVKPDVETQ